MGRSLVIVESPAKAKTINKYLGKNFIVKSSVGHIRDLPTAGGNKKPVDASARAKESARVRKMEPVAKALHQAKKQKSQLIERMGIDPDDGWKARYEILPNKEKVVAELQKLAADADVIYLATDLDREGEAIAWHLQQAIGGDDSRFRRVVFNEITKTAIQEAFKEPGKVDQDRVDAQQARRFLDRVVGYMVSPLLWSKLARGLSAGRVQSVAVRIIVEREREIRAFVPEEYWQMNAMLDDGKVTEALPFEVTKHNGKVYRPTNQQQSDAAVALLQNAAYLVSTREQKPTKAKAGAPFITSTLQQAASTRLGFSVKKTMTMSQRLYEGGHITYMRTDSTNLSSEAVEACREYINEEFGAKYLPEAPVSFSSKQGAQEAHEAIRPTNVKMKGELLSDMERDAQRLYQLIWTQFVACQMPNAEYLSTSLTVTAGEFEMKLRGRVLIFDGFTRVSKPASKREEDRELPDIKQGQILKLNKLDPTQHFTKPTARFTEAGLVKELEKQGIGRPSTYASIISTIQDRGYVKLENRRFYAEKMGDIVTDRLVESFSGLMDFGFTASMEENLDQIARGKQQWINTLDNFYEGFSEQLLKANKPSEDGGMRTNTPTDIGDVNCPDCSRPMMIRTASTGVFLGCSGYALPPKERCKCTINLTAGDEAIAAGLEDEEAETNALRAKRRCPICETAMEAYLIDEKRKLHVCGNNPDCTGHEIEAGEFRIKGYDGPIIECDKCGEDMQLKNGRFGKYFGCTGEACKNTRKLLKSGQAAPPKMDPIDMPDLQCVKVDDHYVLRDGASGLFLAASGFPRNRETRAPLVSEIKPVKAKLPEKYHFLCEAPEKDTDGNPTTIRYSRKTAQQYVMSELEGKATGWKGFFQDDKWLIEEKKVKAKAKAKPKDE